MGVGVRVWSGSVVVEVGLALRGGAGGADATFAVVPSGMMTISVACELLDGVGGLSLGERFVAESYSPGRAGIVW